MPLPDKPDKLVKKPADDKADEGEGKKSPLSWIMGWVVMPSAVIGLIFGSGVLVGVHLHESWFTRLVLWVVDLF
jgi:hypothetical protein